MKYVCIPTFIHGLPSTSLSPLPQVTKLKDEIAKVQQILANKDNETDESIKQATGEMQKASLKLFEIAYKKVREIGVFMISGSLLPI